MHSTVILGNFASRNHHDVTYVSYWRFYTPPATQKFHKKKGTEPRTTLFVHHLQSTRHESPSPVDLWNFKVLWRLIIVTTPANMSNPASSTPQSLQIPPGLPENPREWDKEQLKTFFEVNSEAYSLQDEDIQPIYQNNILGRDLLSLTNECLQVCYKLDSSAASRIHTLITLLIKPPQCKFHLCSFYFLYWQQFLLVAATGVWKHNGLPAIADNLDRLSNVMQSKYCDLFDNNSVCWQYFLQSKHWSQLHCQAQIWSWIELFIC